MLMSVVTFMMSPMPEDDRTIHKNVFHKCLQCLSSLCGKKWPLKNRLFIKENSFWGFLFFTYGGVVVVFVVDAFDRNLPSVKTPNRLWSFYPERVEWPDLVILLLSLQILQDLVTKPLNLANLNVTFSWFLSNKPIFIKSDSWRKKSSPPPPPPLALVEDAKAFGRETGNKIMVKKGKSFFV